MNPFLLAVGKFWVPPPIRKLVLKRIITIVASAGAWDPPLTRGLSEKHLRKQLALFSNARIGQALSFGGDLPTIENRLYLESRKLGAEIRTRLNIRTEEEVFSVSQAMYKLLGIDMIIAENREIIIPHCYFSGYFSPDICRVMGKIDAGFVAGLSGGGTLLFKYRITEGRECCRAYLCFEEKGNE